MCLVVFCWRFCIKFHKGYWSIVFSSGSMFVLLLCQSYVVLIEWVRNCSLLFNILINLRRIGISSFLNVWQNSQWSHKIQGFYLLGDFWCSLLTSYRSNLFLTLWFSLGRFCVSRNFYFRLFSILGYNHSQYNLFYFYRIGSDVYTFTSDFSNLSFFSFLVAHLVRSCQFCCSCQRINFWFY